jgi:hypothetical protein
LPVYQIQDFKSGLDLRKSYATAPAGSLRTLRNCMISAGAEIEKRTAFLAWAPAPAGSLGVLSRNGEIFVVQNGTSGIVDWNPNPPWPNAVAGVISLPFPAGVTITKVQDWDLFNGMFYIVLAGADGKFYHYYQGNMIKGTDGSGNEVLTPDPDWRVTDPMATSSSIRTFGGKMYGVDGRLLRGSRNGQPWSWTPPSGSTNDGSFYADLSAQDADSTNLIGLEVYLGNMAIFSSLSTQIWKLDPDPAQNQFVQLLRSTGLLAPNGLVQFGQDVLYVSSHGVRSLKVQNVSLTAGTTDIGTPIDEIFRALLIQNGAPWFAGARVLISPRSGRVWVVLPDRIYVLSTFQEPAVTAWSVFDAPFNFVDCCVADPWIAVRGSDNMIYLYGSDVAAIYDATQVEVITPALSCESPSKNKIFHSFDVGAEGTWTLSVGCDPNNQATEEPVATFTGSTYVNPTMSMPEQSTHISLRFRSTDASRARLGQVNLMFDDGSMD